MGAPAFAYDVFLSYSSTDWAVVRELAERLKKAGVHPLHELDVALGGPHRQHAAVPQRALEARQAVLGVDGGVLRPRQPGTRRIQGQIRIFVRSTIPAGIESANDVASLDAPLQRLQILDLHQTPGERDGLRGPRVRILKDRRRLDCGVRARGGAHHRMIASFLTIGLQRQQLTSGRPEQYLGIWQTQADSRPSNPLLYVGRNFEFVIRRCFLPYALLFFALLNITKVAFILSAIGANVVWPIALYSYRTFAGVQTSTVASPAPSA